MCWTRNVSVPLHLVELFIRAHYCNCITVSSVFQPLADVDKIPAEYPFKICCCQQFPGSAAIRCHLHSSSGNKYKTHSGNKYKTHSKTDLIKTDPLNFKHYKPHSKERGAWRRNTLKDENPPDPSGFAGGVCPASSVSPYYPNYNDICTRKGISSCLGTPSNQLYIDCG